jgi:hypothetical protein
MVPGFFLCALFWWLPFSPRWLASKGRHLEALKTLSRLRDAPESDPRVLAEWLQIRAEVESQRAAVQLRHPRLTEKHKGKLTFGLDAAMWADCLKMPVLRRTSEFDTRSGFTYRQ